MSGLIRLLIRLSPSGDDLIKTAPIGRCRHLWERGNADSATARQGSICKWRLQKNLKVWTSPHCVSQPLNPPPCHSARSSHIYKITITTHFWVKVEKNYPRSGVWSSLHLLVIQFEIGYLQILAFGGSVSLTWVVPMSHQRRIEFTKYIIQRYLARERNNIQRSIAIDFRCPLVSYPVVNLNFVSQ